MVTRLTKPDEKFGTFNPTPSSGKEKETGEGVNNQADPSVEASINFLNGGLWRDSGWLNVEVRGG